MLAALSLSLVPTIACDAEATVLGFNQNSIVKFPEVIVVAGVNGIVKESVAAPVVGSNLILVGGHLAVIAELA